MTSPEQAPEGTRQVGSVELMEEIGAGGMATVFKGYQRPLDRHVAVKQLKPELSSASDLVQRFRREALSVASLQHENIVSIYDFHESPEGLWMVLEFVDGTDLHDVLARCGKLPSDVAAIIALKIASALEYAHYRKVVHRDIKPSNVMISWQGEVKLTDFGIAKDLTFDDLTRTGLAVGTPSYMSPEQVVGARLDFKSDLFSFGILLYQMLTGDKPFTDDEEGTVLAKIRDEDYPHVRTVNPDVPWSLARIVRKCLQKAPEKRWAATSHLRQALERYLARHVPMNYSGRLVTFLRNRGLVDVADAEIFVDTAILHDSELKRVDLGGPPAPTVWPVALVGAGALVAMSLWIGVVHAGWLGPAAAPTDFPPPPTAATSRWWSRPGPRSTSTGPTSTPRPSPGRSRWPPGHTGCAWRTPGSGTRPLR